MIREAIRSDVPAIVAMGERFASDTDYRDRLTVVPTQLAATAEHLIANDEAVMLVAEREGAVIGMLALLLYPHPMSGERVASEIVWWVEPEHRGSGLRLLRAAERWACEHGAAVLHMIAPNDRIGALYQRLGYVPVETAWQRRI